MGAPQRNTVFDCALQKGKQSIDIQCRSGRCGVCALAADAGFGRPAQQRVKFLRYQLAVGIELHQKIAGLGKAQCVGNPAQVGVIGGQQVGLLVV